ncbi:MAG: ParB family chromosome partitioning protein [Gammaproteobacteria bacterium]|jgi:ParB family chromosome partitioning protein
MSRNNKFGFGPIDPVPPVSKRDRSVGPMGAAVREAAGSLQDSTDALADQRRQNSRDAKAYNAARDGGLMLERVPLDQISTDDLPRDRLDLDGVAVSDEMEELKASIRARGQREPVEVYRDAHGRFQIKKGWRRFTALNQLLAETGDIDAFGTITARIEAAGMDDRMARYIDMVEENVIREDLSFAEMAMVAISAARDVGIDGAEPEDLVARLYGSLHKMKRSYIKSFVVLLKAYGPDLKFPKAVPRNLGVEVVRKSKVAVAQVQIALRAADTPEAQNAVLVEYVRAAAILAAKAPNPKAGLKVGATTVEAKKGSITIKSRVDYSAVSDADMTRAIKAFEAAINA